MKKLLTACLLIFSVIVMSLPVAMASESAVFEIKTPSALPKAGDTFQVSVELSGNAGFAAIQFTLSYNKTLMECEDVITGELLKGAFSSVNNDGHDGAIVAASSLKALGGDGVVAQYTFKAKQDILSYAFVLKDILLTDVKNADIAYEIADKTQEGGPSNPHGGTTGNGNDGADSEITFPDVIGHWAESYIKDAAERGLFIGGTDGKFNPDANVTRAQFITVLWRMAGRPDADNKIPFKDTDNQVQEFKTAIKWGYANGYIQGTSDTTFEPSASLTREAGMRILHEYSGGNTGNEIQFYAVYDGTFKDSNTISDWAKPAVYWGIFNKLISGTSADTLSPKDTATRAQLAKILVSYIDIN